MKSAPRIACLVPSWTETLILSGANVVARTRFCVHPQESVEKIPVVGGTKDLNWDELEKTKPDLLLLDREENPVSFSNDSLWPVVSTHVENLSSMASELSSLSNTLSLPQLQALAGRTQKVIEAPPLTAAWNGMHWWRKPEVASKFIYLIWKNPWIAAGKQTFIGSVMQRLNLELLTLPEASKYPQIAMEAFAEEKVTLLFSSEPYPFARYKRELMKLNYSSALVDGESFSWFGIRSLKFLEQEILKQP